MLSVREAAERLSTSVSTVRRLVKRGELSALKVGFRLKIPEAEIQRYLKEQRVGRLDDNRDDNSDRTD